jgi:kynurenine formamidase
MTRDEFAALIARIDNRGRWGAGDERGTLNHITPERTLAAAALVRDGTAIGLGAELATKPGATPGVASPVHHLLGANGASAGIVDIVADHLALEPHSPAVTHLDALSHVAYEGEMYNGHSVSELTPRGARALGIGVAASGIVTRGVLLDIPRLRGTGWLEPGEAVHAAELEAAERAAGVEVGAGDALLVRTGRHARQAALGAWDVRRSAAGLHPDTLPWLHARAVAVLGGDCGIDAVPAPVEGVHGIPMHIGALRALGMPLLHHCELEALAEAQRAAFLLVVAPLALPRATASPVNPVAVL